MGVRTGPRGSWFHQKSLLEFLDLWSIDLVPQKRWKLRTCFRTSTVFMTEWIMSFVQEMGVRTGQQGSWFHQKSLPEFLDLWSIDWSHIPNCQHKRKKKLFRNNWTVFTRGMGLELCTGDGCKNWPTRELVPQRISFWVSWSVKRRLIAYPNCQCKIKKKCLGTIGLSACGEWILSFVQEMGVRTGPQGSWFHQKNLFLSFLICET